jgi:energy-coupling factor transport system substrate-specific component
MAMDAPTAPARAAPIPTTFVVTLIPAAAALSIAASYVAVLLGLPIYLDAIGTCVIAIVLGPWWGALTGVLTNVGGSFFFGPTNIPFALANVLAALIWGYGVRTFRMGTNPVAYFVLCVIVGVATGAAGGVIALFVFGGATGHPSDVITATLLAAGSALVNAVFTSSILTSVADKVISGFVAVAIIGALPPRYTDGVRLPAAVGTRTLVVATVGTVAGVAILLVYLVALAPPPAA